MNTFFDRNAVRQVLEGLNSWWSGRPVPVPAFRRLAFTHCCRLLSNRALRRATLLSGPRRVGKTTVLLQVAAWLLEQGHPPAGVFYISLDHPLLKLVTLTDILSLYHETIYPEGRPAVLLMDEVQYAKEWDLHVKALVDHQPQYRIIATGSASVVHRQQLAESGVGRWVTVPVPTLSFFEFLRIRGEPAPDVDPDLTPRRLFAKDRTELADVARRLRAVQPLFLHYLLVGGFPETARQPDAALCQRLLREDVVERVLKRDMTALFGVRKVNDLERLFIYLCLHSGGILEVQACAAALEVQRTTVENYLQLLEQANLIYRLAPLALGGKKVLKAKHKVYLVDAALRNAVLLRGDEILGEPGEMGTVVETTVLRHLFAYFYRDTPRLHYWRDTASDREVDIVVQSPRYTVPVEVKYREDGAMPATAGLVAFCRQEAVTTAYWVTKREEDFGLTAFDGLAHPILRIPAHIFTYLLGQAERNLWAGEDAAAPPS